MGRIVWHVVLPLLAAVLIAGCVATPQQHAVKELRVCAAGSCGAARQKYSGAQLIEGVEQLLKTNSGEKVAICEADPKARNCVSDGVCQFVLGGLLPGNGCARNIVFHDVEADRVNGRLALKADMQRTFIGTPMTCTTMTGSLSMPSPDELWLQFEPHYCNWMAVGNMGATFNFAIESLDLDRGVLGVYWSHAVSGTGNGRGSGYALLTFPKSMPHGQNWIPDKNVARAPAADTVPAAP